MNPKSQSFFPLAEFDRPCRALQDTVWVGEPANPLHPDRGYIRRGETIWLHPELMTNTSDWQLARLKNNRVRYIRHNDFELLAQP